MPQQQRFIQLPLIGRVLLCLLASVYLVYLVGLVHLLAPSASSSLAETIVDHPEGTSSEVVMQHWTVANMQDSVDVDQQLGSNATFTGSTIDISKGKAAKEQGQAPGNGDTSYPLSTVGKIFFTNNSGQNFVCSGTSVVSVNHSVVDTAGHCLYWNGNWSQNLIFCPLYDNGNTPYGCWVARDLEVPSDWISPKPNDYHHDLGMAIVSPNSEGKLTDVVGGAGWAYNQAATQPFYAYGYPAAYPFDGQTRKSCDKGDAGKTWKHGDGTVISIPCDMTGGSSGGPWFIKISGKWYLNGHNDFISSMQYGHMFSPYYDDTWYAMYTKAQRT